MKSCLIVSSLLLSSVAFAREPLPMEQDPAGSRYENVSTYIFSIPKNTTIPDHIAKALVAVTGQHDIPAALQSAVDNGSNVDGKCIVDMCEITVHNETTNQQEASGKYQVGFEAIGIDSTGGGTVTVRDGYTIKVPCTQVSGMIEIMENRRKDKGNE